jgi:acetyl esterase
MTPHPYYQAILDAFAAANRPFMHQLSPEAARAQLRAGLAAAPAPVGLPALAAVVDETIAGPHGAIPIRRYVPMGEPLGTCVYLHSGGWVIGDLDFADATCRRLAGAIGAELASVGYRKAPEHPYPQPLDDAFAALEWAAARRPGPLALIGESAGGNLAAACTIRARDRGGPAIAAQFLVYPVTDHDFATDSYREIGDRNWMISTADMRWYWDAYCPPEVDRTAAEISPLRIADAAGLPPAMVIVGELDPLRSEALAYAGKLAAAGVPVRTRCDPGMLHGYLGATTAVPVAAEAMAEAAGWLRDRLRETG